MLVTRTQYIVQSFVCVFVKLLQSCLTLRPHGPYLARLLCPWDFPGKSTGLGGQEIAVETENEFSDSLQMMQSRDLKNKS